MERWTPYFGVALLVAVVGLLWWRISGTAPVWVPKPKAQMTTPIRLKVCGWELATVRRWADHLEPVCQFELVAYHPDSPACTTVVQPAANVLVMGRPPQNGDYRSVANTEIWMLFVDSYYTTPVIRSGRPVRSAVGIMSGTRSTVPRGAPDLVGAHELGHMCGAGHAVQGRGSRVWAPGQVMSWHTERLGESMTGFTMMDVDFDESLIE